MSELTVTQARALLSSSELADVERAIEALAGDGRPGVKSALAAARRRLDGAQRELTRAAGMVDIERALRGTGRRAVAGVDEVGRGALAGPVSAAAVVFATDEPFCGLRDSKVLSPAQRADLDVLIRGRALAVAVAHVDSHVIDAIGIAGATVQAMRLALEALPVVVDHVLVDGLDVPLGLPHTAVVKGDATVRSIAAASIVAKVARDRLMGELDQEHPGYGLAGNKGYGSEGHLRAIVELGPSAVHRMSFAPCAQGSLFARD